MRYRTTSAFDRDLDRLPLEQRSLFVRELREHFLPAVDAGAFSGTPRPRRLRIHRLADTEIYSLTWNFASPDGRATFHIDDSADEPVLVWRRIGDHSIHRAR